MEIQPLRLFIVGGRSLVLCVEGQLTDTEETKKNPPLEGRTFEGRIIGEVRLFSSATEDVIGSSLSGIFECVELSHRGTTHRLRDRVADVASRISLLQTD